MGRKRRLWKGSTNTLGLTSQPRFSVGSFDRFGPATVGKAGKYATPYLDALTYTARGSRDHASEGSRYAAQVEPGARDGEVPLDQGRPVVVGNRSQGRVGRSNPVRPRAHPTGPIPTSQDTIKKAMCSSAQDIR